MNNDDADLGSSTVTPPTGIQADLLHRMGLEAGHAAVVGLQWGDEGKGQIVDQLTGHFDAVVRYNGGNNAGHSVHIGREKFALHLVPSGILYPDKLNIVSNGVVVDPSPDTGILKEIMGLRNRGVSIGENLRISDRAHVVMPYHKVQDALYDEAVAHTWESGTAIGTTGRGIGPCYADKALRTTAIRMGELLDPDRLREKINRVVTIKNVLLSALAGHCGRPFDPFDPQVLWEQAVVQGQNLKSHVTDTFQLLHDTVVSGKRVLFEGANAALLDIDHGTYPFVTSSSTSSLGVGPGTGLPVQTVKNVIGVAKAYTSRVGGGPHPTELQDAVGEHIRNVGKEFGTTTGRPRRCGWLDLTAVRYSAKLNGCTAMVCTGLSVLAGLDPLKVCVGYRYGGRKSENFLPDADVLAQAEPVYEQLEGFSGVIGDIQDYRDLPAPARAYIDRVERFVGVPVRVVCVGPRRDQTILR